MTTLATRMRKQLDRLHGESRGAVAMAAMAACMILFMLSLVLWDAGHAVRDKVDLQNAADSAAYSKAAVEARSMNMLSFTNVAKRTVVGLHNTYWGMYTAYFLWVGRRCSECCSCGFPFPCCRFCACLDCGSNLPLLLAEGFGDWASFSGIPMAPVPTPWGDSGNVFGEELEALDDYQHYITDITPWWGWAEQLLRGARNGATVTASWPPPGDAITRWSNLLSRILRIIPGAPTPDTTTWEDGLPVSIDHNTLFGVINNFLPSNQAAILNRVTGFFGINSLVGSLRDVFYNLETCSPQVPGTSPLTPGGALESGANIAYHAARSENPPVTCTGGPASGNLIAAGSAMAISLCPLSAVLPQFREAMGPAYLRGSESIFTGQPADPSSLPNSARELQRRSSVIFAYKRAPKFQGQLRDNFNILDDEYYNRGSVNQGFQNPMFNASGQWALSRSELAYTNRVPGGLNNGIHNTWMWHAGWTAKLRPLALDGEFDAMAPGWNQSYFSSMYHDVLPYLVGGGAILNLVNNAGTNRQLAWDIMYMEKVTKAMDNRTVDGTPQ